MHDHRARSVSGQSSGPAPIFPSRPCSPIGRPANDPCGKSCTHASTGSIARLATHRTLICFVTAIAPFMCDVVGSAFPGSSARAQTAAHSEAVERFAKFIEEASGRFAVPARWIRAVMRVESGGDEHAISSRGAMGLMQLMPGTWVELRPLWSRRRSIRRSRQHHRGYRVPRRHERSFRIGRLRCCVSCWSSAI